MNVSYISLRPHDPIIARDSRPFSIGIRMKSLDWPYPSVLAGSVRTVLGKMKMRSSPADQSAFGHTEVAALKDVVIHGPLPVFCNTLYFPAPKDILVKDSQGKCDETYAIRPAPLEEGEGCDLPEGICQPPMLSSRARDEFKPATIAAFWSVDTIASWLVNPDGLRFEAPSVQDKGEKIPDGLDQPSKESRFHSEINRDRGVAEDSLLFETIGLDLHLKNKPEGISLSARIETAANNHYANPEFGTFGAFGGERRLTYFKKDKNHPDGWECPEKVTNALKSASRIRMILATPAGFSQGWLPGWIDKKSLTGTPPCVPENQADKICLKLVSACIDRWKPLSGFSLDKETRGPKILRRIVPAGSVYFFEIESGKSLDLAQYWLQPVSDALQDRKDGFGLALWGIWDYEQNSGSIRKKMEEKL